MLPEYAVETKNLGKLYWTNWAVKNLNMKIPTGSVYGLLGLNGAGKSTTLRMLMGLIRISLGSAKVLGMNPSREAIFIKENVGYVGDTGYYYDWMRVDDVILFAANYRKKNWNMRLAKSLMNRFDLDGRKKIKELSKGMIAKLSLCLAISFEPAMLILDEPTGGLDPVARREFFEGILAEYQNPQRTILISSHLINEVSGIVDRIGVLHKGNIIKECSSDEFLASVKKARMKMQDEIMKKMPLIPGLFNIRKDNHEIMGTIIDADKEMVIQGINKAGGTDVEIIDLNLEDAFIEYISVIKNKN